VLALVWVGAASGFSTAGSAPTLTTAAALDCHLAGTHLARRPCNVQAVTGAGPATYDDVNASEEDA